MRSLKIFTAVIPSLILMSCQTAQEKSAERVQSVALMFRPFESVVQKTCKIQVSLSAPTAERYRQSFPEEKDLLEVAQFDWEVREDRCRLKADPEPTGSPWFKNHEVVIKASVCTLVQGFGIESPFVGLSLLPADIQTAGEWSQILSARTRKPVIEVHNTIADLRVLTEKNQNYSASYELVRQRPRLKEVVMTAKDSELSVKDFKFQDLSGEVSSVYPREISEFSIYTRDAQTPEAQLYATVKVTQCL